MCAKQAGEPSLARVELFTQNAYFAFQVIQVFLVVTVASSASSLIKSISKDPSSTPSLLAERIPRASNFYINYFVVQGLTVASGVLSQVVGFIIFSVLYKYLAGTPRKMYQKWANLSAISWGSSLPVFTNIAVIGEYSLTPTLYQSNTLRSGLLVHCTTRPRLRDHWNVPLLPRLSLQHPLRN